MIQPFSISSTYVPLNPSETLLSRSANETPDLDDGDVEHPGAIQKVTPRAAPPPRSHKRLYSSSSESSGGGSSSDSHRPPAKKRSKPSLVDGGRTPRARNDLALPGDNAEDGSDKDDSDREDNAPGDFYPIDVGVTFQCNILANIAICR